MRGGVLKYAAQATSQIDAEIGKKDHFWMETILSVVDWQGFEVGEWGRFAERSTERPFFRLTFPFHFKTLT